MAEPRDRWLLGAVVLSGAAALGYEILWTRLLALTLGSASVGMLGALVGFFGGMAVGAAGLHRRVQRSPDPAGLFVRLELAAATFAAVSPWWLYGLARWLPPLIGPGGAGSGHGSALALTIGVAAMALFPGTVCLGATLPALFEARRRAHPSEPGGRGLGRLYAAHTAGAVLGALGTVHLLLPSGGVRGAALLLAALGVVAAGLARRGTARAGAPSAPAPEDPSAPRIDASADPDPEIANEPWLVLALLAGTGLVGVGLEIIAVQILSQVLENTLFTFAHVLAVYLLGTAAGAAGYARAARRAVAGRPATVAAGLLWAHAAAAVWSAGMLGLAPRVVDTIGGPGSSAGLQMLAEVVVAGLVLGPATLLMGALFAHLVGLLGPRGIGHAVAFNTLGSAAAPFVFGLGVLPSMGYRDAMFAVVYAYVGLFGVFTWFRRFRPALQIGAIVGIVGLTTTAPDSLLLVTQGPQWQRSAEDWRVLESHETLLGAVVVSEYRPDGDAQPGPPRRRLQVGQEFRMGGSGAIGEPRMGHLPLLLHPAPKRALYLGVGTGATLGAVRAHPSLERVDAVELVPAVLELLHYFSASNGNVEADERVHLHAADARRFVAASRDHYDVIVADLFHPGRDGAGRLYAREHFENIAARLTSDGLFAQWLPVYQLDPETLRVIVRTFGSVFPDVRVWLGVYSVEHPAVVLVGRRSSEDGPQPVNVDALAARMSAPVYDPLLMDPLDLWGAFLMDAPALADWAGEGPLDHDLQPWVSLRAPKSAYEESRTRGRDNVMDLWRARVSVPDAMLTADDPRSLPRWGDEIDAFATALGHYLEGESTRLDQPEGPPGLIAGAPHYLAAYEAAPGFRPARGMLVTVATAVPARADDIFEAMLRRTPEERRVWQAYIQSLNARGDPRATQALEDARHALGLPATARP